MTTTHPIPTPPAIVAPNADRWFVRFGVATLVALAVTVGMLAAGADAWRVPFVLAHLGALAALIPLGIALLRSAVARERGEGSWLTGFRRAIGAHPLVSAMVAVALITAAISISQFTGDRTVRATANGLTVGMIVLLVARYWRTRSALEAESPATRER